MADSSIAMNSKCFIDHPLAWKVRSWNALVVDQDRVAAWDGSASIDEAISDERHTVTRGVGRASDIMTSAALIPAQNLGHRV